MRTLTAGSAGLPLAGGELFPLTPLKAWYVMQGWEVVPAGGMTLEQAGRLPGRVEVGDWPSVQLWQC